jgi:hypothetical protein
MRCGRALSLLVVVAGAMAGVVASMAAPARAAAAESAQVRFAESSLQVVENRGHVGVLVERVDLPVSRLLVHYRTESVVSSAEAGTDYVHTAGTLVFDVGVRSNVFTVWVRDDDVAEPTEHLLLHLETSSGTGASARLTILDDDVDTAEDEAVAAPSGGAPKSPGGAGAGTAPSGPVVVASSAGSSRPVAVAPSRPVRTRIPAARPAPPRRIILQQTPTTPFELRPTGGSISGSGMVKVDPLLALGAGLLLARVAAEAWFRARIALA